MSVVLPNKNTEDKSFVLKCKEDSMNAENTKSRGNKPAGISYHKHNNPQNDLNIWRSSVVRAKPLPINIGQSKDRKCLG